MTDFSWLSAEAKNIHLIFQNLFYTFVTLLLVIGICLEYFKFSVGQLPSMLNLLGRCLVAAIMLVTFPEILNFIADVVDSVTAQIGDMNEFKLVLAKMGDKLDELSWSWTSVKKMTIVAISFVAYFALYVSVYISDAIYLYAWTLLYIFSPILIALYVLPQTAGATRGLFSSILHVASWKVIWSVLATLLWSAALIDIEKLGATTNFLTIILFNLMLAGSLILTPLISRALFSGGFAESAGKLSGVAIGAGTFAAGKVAALPPIRRAINGAKGMPRNFGSYAKYRYYSHKDSQAIKQNPKLRYEPTSLPSAMKEQKMNERKQSHLRRQEVRQNPYKQYQTPNARRKK